MGPAREFSPRSFSLLALRLERDLKREDAGTSLFVAASDDDAIGTEATLELAWCLAHELGHTVLMIDATFDVRSLSDALGLAQCAGLAEALDTANRGAGWLERLVQKTDHERIAILPVGSRLAGRSVSVRAEAVRELLANAGSSYDFVLVQGSLLIEGSQSMAFCSLVDAALLVAVEEKTTLNQVKRGKRIMNDCGAHRVALVLTNRPRVVIAQPPQEPSTRPQS